MTYGTRTDYHPATSKLLQRISIVLVLVGGAYIGVSEAGAADCPVGSQQTLTGSMKEAVESGDGNWLSMSTENVQPCSVEMLQGKGKVPAGCGFGEYFGNKRFTATGVVQDSIRLVLVVTSIRCS